jgi:hypothetical protein
MNHGISILQGGHHVAQKFSNTGFPCKADNRTGWPEESFNVKSGATAPIASFDGMEFV